MRIQAQSLVGLVRSYPRNSEVVHEGDRARGVYEVISGTACTCRMLREGRRQIVGFYFAGDVFGLESAEQHSLAALAVTDAKVRIVKKQALSALASSDGEVAHRLLSLTSRELARRQNLLLLLSRSAQERLIYFLVEMAYRAPANENVIPLPMSRQDIADYLGLTIETVSRMFWDLERRGAIKITSRRSIELLNQSTNGKAQDQRLLDIFEGAKGRRPKTDYELAVWLASLEGKAATLFNVTSISRWGERARC